MGDIPAYVLVSIDLYRLLLEAGDREEGLALIEETATSVERSNPSPEMLALIRRWVEEAPAADSAMDLRDSLEAL